MDEIIQIKNRYYILATSPRADETSHVLKHGETFAIFNRFGDVQPVGLGEEGIFHEGTRHLNLLRLRFGALRPLLLSSAVREDNALLAVDLTNPDVTFDDEDAILPRDTVHLLRTAFLWDGRCHLRLSMRNFGSGSVRVPLTLQFDADFVDIFEVRGTRRATRGRSLATVVEGANVALAYEGLDRIVRRTRLEFDPPPQELTASEARYRLDFAPGEALDCFVTIACESSSDNAGVAEGAPRASTTSNYAEAIDRLMQGLEAARGAAARVETSNEQFNQWLHRSAADLRLMLTQTPHGPYPYAGVPWFSTAFGRDGLITALECLWVNPSMARGVLAFLAALQADAVEPERDAEPGKILHEVRRGEMANLREIPFGRYYGSVDATPLFVVLAGAYHRRTADAAFIESIWPHVNRALQWIDEWADLDGDGFVEYARRSRTGLVTQGWKDSHDSVFDADGSLAEGPVALCEVQGYVYAAWCAATDLAAALGDGDAARQYAQRVERLRERFDRAFWCEELGTYALALDGAKRPCRVRASNAGHTLWSGIATDERAARVADAFLDETFFSGWGVRTVASTEARYNPMSYHNGSVWPHDNALIAAGLARYGLKGHVMTILRGLFDASIFVHLHRLPELFCGFERRAGEGPTLYPVACAPQSWAAGAVFLLLEACLGLSIDAAARRLRFDRPALPESLQRVSLFNLRIGDTAVDLNIERHPRNVAINIVRREGDVEIVVAK